ncbi:MULTISPECIES: hypothetical protein [Flammeovirga]|uniref:Uncharacterized protein n=1 Tax=Flammeovirga agarivorans TaxID=2726742 RepID=A0A7X8XWP5_9BACT|nr:MULTISPECIES: hypothetical protein [Flammeovirga]NLR92461.1 hypothetical protein [Flammeovirga agarivorans]
MKLKNFITITNFLPTAKGGTILFAPTGNNSLAKWIKMDKEFNWVERVLNSSNTDVCLYTDGEISLEYAAHLVMTDDEIMSQFIWKDTVAYTQKELIDLAHLNEKISWHDIAFADRLILNDEFPSNYYFAKKVNPNALSLSKNINKLIKKANNSKVYVEKINEQLSCFVLPLKAETSIDYSLELMNNILIGGEKKIYRLEAKVDFNNNQVNIKKVGEKLIHSISLENKSDCSNYIFGVVDLSTEGTKSFLNTIWEDISPAEEQIEYIMSQI